MVNNSKENHHRRGTIYGLLLVTVIVLSVGLSTYKNQLKRDLNNDNKPNEEELGVSLQERLNKQSEIKKIESIEELKKILQSASYQNNDMYIRSPGRAFEADGIAAAPTSMGDVSMNKSEITQAESEYSSTNVQVKGVDEADIIKTDGKYIYAVSDEKLFIIEAYPAKEAKILSQIEFKSNPQNIYVDNDKLVVFGGNNHIYDDPMFKTITRSRGSFTYLKVFDISDKKAPKIERELNFEGSYFNSRLIGNQLYFITNLYSYYYNEAEPIPYPRVFDGGSLLTPYTKNQLPDIYHFSLPYSSFTYSNLARIDISKPESEIETEMYLLPSSQNMFVSKNNIYLTYTKYVSEEEISLDIVKKLLLPELPETEKEKINEIENSADYVLSQKEKDQKTKKIIEIYIQKMDPQERYSWEEKFEQTLSETYESLFDELEKTVIHKISISNNEMEYDGFGEVSGSVLNQFSMDENKGFFRIATTLRRNFSRYLREEKPSTSSVFVLDENLEITGKVQGLAPEERIYSARFMGDRVYLVTFKQVDPLFAIDLSDAHNPKVLGELKIPGFSNYLHPYDNETLIGIGKETEINEWGGTRNMGLKLSLFDVSDVSNPKELNKYVFEDRSSDSIALNEHKAFLFDKEKNLLVLPVNLNKNIEAIEAELSQPPMISNDEMPLIIDNYFNGAAVFDINKTNGFNLKKLIEHESNNEKENRKYSSYENQVQRSLYINDVLYTYSQNLIKMNDLDSLDEIKEVRLEMENDFVITSKDE